MSCNSCHSSESNSSSKVNSSDGLVYTPIKESSVLNKAEVENYNVGKVRFKKTFVLPF